MLNLMILLLVQPMLHCPLVADDLLIKAWVFNKLRL